MMESDSVCDIKTFKSGSEQALELLFRTYYPELYRVAFIYLLDRQQAEDVVQDVFVAVWESRKKISEETIMRHYLYTCVKHACFDTLKHLHVVDKHREKLKEMLAKAEDAEVDYEKDDDLTLEIYRAMELLPTQQRQILKLKIVEGMNYKQISEFLNISEGTVHTHIKRAYKSLRKSSHIFIYLL